MMILDLTTTLTKANKYLIDFFEKYTSEFWFWLIVIGVFIVFLLLIKGAFKD